MFDYSDQGIIQTIEPIRSKVIKRINQLDRRKLFGLILEFSEKIHVLLFAKKSLALYSSKYGSIMMAELITRNKFPSSQNHEITNLKYNNFYLVTHLDDLK